MECFIITINTIEKTVIQYKKMKTLLLFVALILLTKQDSIFNLNLLADPTAKCLDGSRGAFYVSNGIGRNKTKFMLYFEGGGWCGHRSGLNKTLESCYKRSLTERGSSVQYPLLKSLNSGGPLSGNPTVNRLYYDWTRVILKYCDGTGHQGSRSLPVEFNKTKLYFRGGNITKSIFAELQKNYGFWNATDIVLSGCSAGSQAALTWLNYVKANARPSANVVAIPDSGVFLDEENVFTKKREYRERIQNFMALSNSETDPPTPECIAANPKQKWRCMFAQYLYPFLKAPVFIINSLYDSWSLHAILGLECAAKDNSLLTCDETARFFANGYRDKMASLLANISRVSPRNGVWAPACSKHCYQIDAWDQKEIAAVPDKSRWTIQKSIETWYQNPFNSTLNRHIDSVNWPFNSGCKLLS